MHGLPDEHVDIASVNSAITMCSAPLIGWLVVAQVERNRSALCRCCMVGFALFHAETQQSLLVAYVLISGASGITMPLYRRF